MGIELPAVLRPLAALVGLQWPEADEDKMREAAGAWREAGTRMGALTGDADSAARTTLATFSGEANDAARRHWSGFVAPDTGHLTAAVTRCAANADTLEHAATQIGEAKVAMVRTLVDLAKQTDAANTAAGAGGGGAPLLQLQTLTAGVKANLAHITTSLIGAVTGGEGNYHGPVNTHPGTSSGPGNAAGHGLFGNHGTDGLTFQPGGQRPGGGGLLGLPNFDVAGAVQGVTQALTPHGPTAEQVANAGAGANWGGPGAGHGGGPGHGGLLGGVLNAAGHVADAALGATGQVVDGALHGASNAVHGVSDAVGGLTGAPPGRGPLDGVAHVVDQVAQTGHQANQGVQHAVHDALNPGGGPGGPGGHPGGGPAGGHGPAAPAPGGHPITDLPGAVTDLPGQVVSHLPGGGGAGAPLVDLPVHHDSVQAASAAVLDAPAASAGAQAPAAGSAAGAVPGAAAGAAQQVQQNVGNYVSGGNGPVPGGPPAAAAPAAGAAAVAAKPAAPVGGVVPGAPVAGGPGGGAAGGGRSDAPGNRTEPGAKVAAGAGSSGSATTGGRQAGADPATTATENKQGTKSTQDRAEAPHARKDEVGGVVAVGMGIQGTLAGQVPPSPDEARQSRVADLLGGRLAGSAPQTPGTPAGMQPAAPLPRAAGRAGDPEFTAFLVAMFPIGHMPVASPEPARQLAAPPAELDCAGRFAPGDHPRSDLVDLSTRVSDPGQFDGAEAPHLATDHDPLGGQHERDWDRRFLVRPHEPGSEDATEFAWPPAGVFPEGCAEAGLPEVLDPGTVVDRFGTPEGRVFSADGTPFARRSLPPTHLSAGYHRYRVLRPLPVWRGVSAPWFAQPGGAERYRATHPAADLIALGYLQEITPDDLPAVPDSPETAA
ncbi:TNT domain-containing protein [Actinokineospora bangkokensis]|uniref:DUF4237 domain-containing protein n=1 Tax=Actinokineospora bangkokensis TaxID=1193682 RepID=A0A1Q9LEM3_9PSEU|nr:TNT domain-containing protein [Actinokineospora bangkokensis]OLR90463.1 hypothetical protein BJP25_27870 [Actinokineospora bangkokensis]